MNYSASYSLVLIPGWSMPAATLESLADSLSAEWPVTVLKWPTELEVWQYQDRLLDAMAVQLPEGPVVLVGWSLGGQLASLLAGLITKANGYGVTGYSEAAVWNSFSSKGQGWPFRAVEECAVIPYQTLNLASSTLTQRERRGQAALVTLASNPCFVANQDWPFGMAQPTFNAFQQGFNQLPTKTLKEFCLLVAKGAGKCRATAKRLQQLQPQAGLSNEVLAEGLKLLATLDTRNLLQQLTCPQLHLLGAKDALVNHQLVEWFQKQEIPVDMLANSGHYLMADTVELVSKIKQFAMGCNQ
ncbi:alpha/beta fold hydrolase [Spartinivicinus poritis]|uniref:Alpha/beta fold hydrolase n=1 Tax=Spartinivicinus poritis TaxID=2994640 RepID=A0ABT5U9T2_9GAMM|nr:alpha/beta fold hydrolase [Spartinivicinus sp. A2-2]MDE1463131.1 alpha/beta fold hydrolase [Spartinivicinus sp. A2-2]